MHFRVLQARITSVDALSVAGYEIEAGNNRAGGYPPFSEGEIPGIPLGPTQRVTSSSALIVYKITSKRAARKAAISVLMPHLRREAWRKVRAWLGTARRGPIVTDAESPTD